MTASIIDGTARAARITDEVATQVRERLAAGKATPGLAVVLVGAHAASMVYVRNKRRITDDVGMRSLSFDLPATTTQPELFALIDRLNADPTVQGILVQLPLPEHIHVDEVAERIHPDKDVDAFHPYNLGRLVLKRPRLRPCTPYGCMILLRDTGEDLVGKHAVVIGQSNIVGRPMALELLMARCTVTICHSATRDLPGIDRYLYTDMATYLPECLMVKMDIASMANSLETRSPFLDHEFVELVARFPDGIPLRFSSLTAPLFNAVLTAQLSPNSAAQSARAIAVCLASFVRTSV